jgi:acyl-CoA dehydrogenase
MVHQFAESMVRPISRELDEKEHEKPWDLIKSIHSMTKGGGMSGMGKREDKTSSDGSKKPGEGFLTAAVLTETRTWGCAGVALSLAGGGLGGAAIEATGTPEQKKKFLARYSEEEPKFGAMAITEPGAGSDSAAISTTARKEGDHWVLNGEKIFVTSGKYAEIIVVWATLDKKAGRAGIKPFIVEKGTPGMTVTKQEHKLGIRCSDTVSIVFEDCKIPLDNVLGNPEVQDKGSNKGFKGVMATFDATRPIVAAMALGVGTAAFELTRDTLEKEGVIPRYGISQTKMTAAERDLMDMETALKAARLLTWRAVWMMDRKLPNNLEASMAKAKAGRAVTLVTQKAVELLGPLGYSRKCLVEKWMRDAKINDIFEGTGQIQTLIVARRILGYGAKELK